MNGKSIIHKIVNGSKRGLSFILAILICAFFVFSAPSAFSGQLEFHVINVGQGDSMFFKLPAGEIVLIDGGPADAGERVVSYLQSAGVKRIDLLIATHPHEDHIGGLSAVFDSFPVSVVWDPGFNLGSATQRKFLERVRNSEAKLKVVRAGHSQKIGDAEIKVLAPVNKNQARKNSDANDSSIVAHVSWKKISFLLTGDAEHSNRKIIDKYPRSTVLKVAHHGSGGGTTKRILQNVKPQAAVVSYGEGNSYGHPHRDVVKLLNDFNVKLYATVHGNIVLKSDGENFSVNYDDSAGWSIIDIIKSIFEW